METPLPESPQLPGGAVAREPGSLGSLRPPRLNVGLFLLTALSTLGAGALLDEPAGLSPWRTLGRAAAFSAALLAILLAHEMGHFLAARRHGVDASWPYFIPAPLLSFIGTFGALIRLRETPRSRAALLDIGAAGPLAGFLVTLPVVWFGMKLSTVGPAEGAIVPWTLWDAAEIALRTGDWPALRDGAELGEPLLLQLCERLAFGALPDTQSITLHPVAVAGWFGLLVTALNLLPLGQLDGGHVLYAVSARLHRFFGAPLSALLFALGVFTPFVGWSLWGLATGTFLSQHPPLEPGSPPLGRRWVLVGLCLVVFALSFSPVPLAMLRK